MTTRDELEAVIRREFSDTAWAILDDGEIGDKVTRLMNDAVTKILQAAAAYAVAEHAALATRQAALASPESEHWPVHWPRGDLTACHPDGQRRKRATRVTADPAKVTCKACKRTPAWQEAAGPRPEPARPVPSVLTGLVRAGS